jgi:hypothetical protein
MFSRETLIRSAGCFIGALTIAAAVLSACPARAQGKLDARYAFSVAGVRVGESAWSVDIGPEQYTASATSRMTGIVRWLVRGEGSAAVRGAIKDGQLTPSEFTARAITDDETSETRMTLEAGNVTELIDAIPSTVTDRVPVAEEHRKGIVDPLSAMLIPAGAGERTLMREACEYTLPIFDGRRRYNLGLAYKRADKVKTTGYAGPVVVCAMAMQALSGHREGGVLVGYLTEGSDMELWLAPIAGTRFLAPVRITVGGVVNTLVMQATRFEVTAHPTEPAPAPLETGEKTQQ